MRRLAELALVLVAVTGLASCGWSEPREPGPSRVELSKGWQLRHGDSPKDERGRLEWLSEGWEAPGWEAVDLPAAISNDEGWLWMRVRLPERTWPDATLAIDPILMSYEAYVDGELLHSVGEVEAGRYGGLPWELVRLPAGRWQGRVLALRVRSPWTGRVGILGTVQIGSRSSHVEAVVGRDVFAFGVAFVGALVALMALLGAAVGLQRRLALALALYAAGTCAYVLFYTKTKALLLDSPLFWSDLHEASVHAAIVGLLTFVESAFGAGPKRVVRRLWQIHLAWLVPFVCVAALWGIRGSGSLDGRIEQLGLLGLRLLIVVEVICVLVVGALAARRGNRDAWIFLLGAFPGAVFTARDVAAAFGLIEFSWDTSIHWSFLSMLVALVVIALRMYTRELDRFADEIDRKTREKELMLRDLHDGIGGITANISLLADVASRAPSEGTADKAIRDISNLSREGMSEIRSFLDSLDERELSWKRLVTELRRLGNRTLEPHGIELDLESALDPRAPPPHSLVYLNVLRIFREALTNVVKHAGARHVEARVETSPDSFRILVEDDGVGLSDAAEGRGLPNMRSRASQLGGHVEIRSGSGTSVELTVPLPDVTPDRGARAPLAEA